MTARPSLPRIDIEQLDLPGTDGTHAFLVLHACTPQNYSQRITVARRRPSGKATHYDIQLTREQVLHLIDHLIDCVDTMTDTVPGANP